MPVIACNCRVCQSDDAKDNRLRASVLIETQGKNFVIDTGPDFRQQMLREKVRRLDAILFTHQHKDHIAGLDDVRAFNFQTKKAVEIYAEQRVIDSLKLEFAYAFEQAPYPGTPEFNIHKISTRQFTVEGTPIQPLRLYHYKLPVLGFRIGDFSYMTDVSAIPDQAIEQARGSRVVVLDALRHKPHISHFNLEQAIAAAEKIGAPETYFTHISHAMGRHARINPQLPKGMALGYDGQKISI